MTTMGPRPALAVAAALMAALPAYAQDRQSSEVTCMEVPEPVVSLSHGSRYTDDSEDRSDFDESSNDAVNAALEPIDSFISTLAARANTALSEDDPEAAACVVDALAVWARAEAFSELGTMNANLSSPSRLGGMALAYLQVRDMVTDRAAERDAVEHWLSDRARNSATWFDKEAPPMASRNNLRAWAGLAAVAAGEASEDGWLVSWGAHTVATVACQADEDGALPLEMSRGPLALHYQLHAVAPLVVSSAMLERQGYPAFSQCDDAVPRIVAFTLDALETEGLAEAKAGEKQTLHDDDEVQGFELAWAEAYLSVLDDPRVDAFVADYRPLGNTKLGGTQSLLW